MSKKNVMLYAYWYVDDFPCLNLIKKIMLFCYIMIQSWFTCPVAVGAKLEFEIEVIPTGAQRLAH